jgi:hypothetical protein
MKRVAKTAGLCLASVLVAGMALAGNASATLLWSVCLKGSGLTKYTSSKCLTAGSGGEWQLLGVPKGTLITVKLLAISILLRDTGISAAVLCFGTGSKGEGVIEEGGKGKVRVSEYENAKADCRGIEGCEKEGIETIKAVNLPWNTEVYEGTNGKPLGRVSNGGSGEPGWEVVCKVAGVKKTDICEMEAGHPEEAELVNELTKNSAGETELLVKGRSQQVGEGKCTLGGAKSQKISGSGVGLLLGGALALTAS